VNSPDICVVGLGPAGLGAALQLALFSNGVRVLAVDSGPAARFRTCTILQQKGCRRVSPCHMLGGLGGAALLSGGKISEFPAGRSLQQFLPPSVDVANELSAALDFLETFIPLQRRYLKDSTTHQAEEIFAEKGFSYRYYPAHTYRRPDMIEGIERMAGEIQTRGAVRLTTEVTSLKARTDGSWQLGLQSNGKITQVTTGSVVFAGGRLGNPLVMETLREEGIEPQPNRPEVGVRLEFPTRFWPELSRWHNDLKLHFGNARTFCVCQDGSLAPYRWKDSLWLEGFADPALKTGLSNLAVTVRLAEHSPAELVGMRRAIQSHTRAISGGQPVRELLSSVLGLRTQPGHEAVSGSSIRYWKWGKTLQCFPPPIRESIHDAVHFFATQTFAPKLWDAISVFAPEADYLSPRIQVGRNFETGLSNLWVVGDTTGHFRGILQAFASGRIGASTVIGGSRG
jgi:uncharacterized protein